MESDSNPLKISIIGAGNIGTAMARGLAAAGYAVTIYNRSAGRLDRFACSGMTCTTDIVEAACHASIVLICVEGQAVPAVTRALAPHIDAAATMIGSCAAALNVNELQQLLANADGTCPRVFRLLPNIAATVGLSTNLLCGSADIDGDELRRLASLFDCTGTTEIVPEQLFGAAMALSSCGVAYVLRYVRATMLAGVQMGLSAETSCHLTTGVLKGVAALLASEGAHPEELIDRVTTPGGITIRGLNAMEKAGFSASIVEGLTATTRK